MSLTKSYLINGPNNVVRLSNGNKILYIFGDYHIDANLQYECLYNDEYESMDIDKFLSMFMRKNKDKQIDLFMEMHKEELIPSMYNYRARYIDSIIKLFKNRLVKHKDEIKINPKYPHFRFHYMDIRNSIIFFNKIFYYIENNIYKNYINKSSYYIQSFTDLREMLKVTLNQIKNENKNIQKILNKYSNLDIKQKINKLFQNIFIKNYNKNFELIDTLLDIFNNNNINISNKEIDEKIQNLIQELDNTLKYSFTFLTDLFFIRRFLDKNYINNTILYTGAAHMCDIIYILVRYFEFDITHIYYKPNEYNITEEINKITDNEYFYINNILTKLRNELSNSSIYQCVDLFNFPENFS